MGKLSVFTVMYRLLISCFSLFFNYLAPSSLLLRIEHNESHIANYLRPLFFYEQLYFKAGTILRHIAGRQFLRSSISILCVYWKHHNLPAARTECEELLCDCEVIRLWACKPEHKGTITLGFIYYLQTGNLAMLLYVLKEWSGMKLLTCD